MPSLKDWVPGDVFQCLVVSPFKGGKTWGAGTFPRPNFMDFDRGIDTLRNPAWVSKYGMRDIQYEQFREKNVNAQGVITSHNAFDDACRYFDKCMKAGERDKFDSWVIDSGSSLSDFAANKAMFLMGADAVGQKSFTHKQALLTGLVVPKQQDYAAERSMVEQFIDMILSSGKHVAFLCHEKVLTDDQGNMKSIVPLLTGKSQEVVPSKFSEVYHLILKRKGLEISRELQTQPDMIRRCGSRIGIPNGIPWEWDAIQAELKKIRLAQAVVGNTLPSAK